VDSSDDIAVPAGYWEHIIGVSGTFRSGYQEQTFGLSGTGGIDITLIFHSDLTSLNPLTLLT
jgi:hypothetical protein